MCLACYHLIDHLLPKLGYPNAQIIQDRTNWRPWIVRLEPGGEVITMHTPEEFRAKMWELKGRDVAPTEPQNEEKHQQMVLFEF